MKKLISTDSDRVDFNESDSSDTKLAIERPAKEGDVGEVPYVMHSND